MIKDKTLEVVEKADLASTENEAQIGQIIDLGEPAQERYVQPFVIVTSEETAAGGTSFGMVLQTAEELNNEGEANESLKDAEDLFVVNPVAVENLKRGEAVAVFRMPFGAKRYIAFKATVNGTFTAGKVSINFANDVAKLTPFVQ